MVALAGGGRDIPEDAAEGLIFGYAVGLDMTRRDLQAAAKKAGRPWEAAKAFEGSAPCGPILPVSVLPGRPASGEITLRQNGEIRQRGDLADMIWSVPAAISALSGLFELAAGDLLFTGTPAGVGPVAPGDRLRAEIAGIGALEVEVR